VTRKIIIMEGPDGAGKTTLARKIVAMLPGCFFHHHGPYPNIQGGLHHVYAQTMAPAVLNRCDVVLDRCWISEKPYGVAFRGGADRITPDQVDMLETMAARCRTTVIICLPPWETVQTNFIERKGAGQEYLAGVQQLHVVYEWYRTKAALANITALHSVVIDPFSSDNDLAIIEGYYK
jgi:thymidylate kinase